MRQLLFHVWCIGWGIVISTMLVPATHHMMVIVRYGWAGHAAGIRVSETRPPQFTNGERFGSALVAPVGFGVGITMLTVALAPAFLVPSRRHRGERGFRERPRTDG